MDTKEVHFKRNDGVELMEYDKNKWILRGIHGLVYIWDPREDKWTFAYNIKNMAEVTMSYDDAIMLMSNVDFLGPKHT